MAGTVKIESILNQIKQLSYLERIAVLEKTLSLIKKEGKAKEKHKLSSIGGVGSEIWKDVETDKYLDEERQWTI